MLFFDPTVVTDMTADGMADPISPVIPTNLEQNQSSTPNAEVVPAQSGTPSPQPEVTEQETSQSEEILAAPMKKGRVLKIAVVAGLLLLGVFVAIPKEGRSFAATAPESVPVEILAASVPTPEQVASNDQVRALTHFEQNGTFEGFVPAQAGTARYGYHNEILVIGRDYEGDCWVYSVVNSTPSDIVKDDSGYGCTPAAIDQFDKRMRELN